MKLRLSVALSRTVVAGLLVLSAGVATAEDLPVPPEPVAATERVDGRLFELARDIPAAQRGDLIAPLRESFRKRATTLGVKVRADDKLFVEFVGPADGQIERDLALPKLEALGIEIGLPVEGSLARPGAQAHVALSRTATQAEAWLPLTAIERMEALLPKGWRVRPVQAPQPDQAVAVVGEGPARINSLAYRDAGSNGNGLTIAIIDGGFSGLTAARNNGDAPAAALINLTGDADFESGTETHGTDCVQSVFDHAPGAGYRIYRIDSSADYQAVITDCIANGVDVISHSLSQYNEGWGDDTGPSCQQANRAGQNNILFFTSAGNRARSHYEGAFTDANSDNFHEFAPNDQTIDVTIGMNTGGSHYLSWSNASSDYDLFLYNSDNTIVASSANAGVNVFETIHYTNTGAQATFHLVVRFRAGARNSTIEIFSHNSATWNEHAVATGSTTSPSNATNPNVISVGAVTESSYASAAGSDVIAGYSSRGPSNSGMTLPDISGPTDTLVFPQPAPPAPPSPPNRFSGTSCATPNSAGAAAAFWSADRDLRADAIRWLLHGQATAYRDWGAGGFDGVYGAGGIRLVDFRAGTRWLARNYPGTLDDGTAPFHTVAGAHQRVPNGGRLIFFGANFGTFPEPVQLGHIGKTFTVEALPNTGPAAIGP